MTAGPAPLASIVISTHNRLDDILCAIASCYAQDWQNLEVLVFDDASDLKVGDVVKAQYPGVRCFTNIVRRGYIANRNRGFREAMGRYVFSLDDDAYFASTDIVRATVDTLEADSGIGAIAIPYIEPLQRRAVSSLKSPMRAKALDELQGFVGCAHALRRDAVLKLGGYHDFFVHQGEERDLALRMRDAGWRIVYGPKGYVVHLVSTNRDQRRVIYYGARNQILFDVLNVPFPEVTFRIAWHIVAIIKYRFNLSAFGTKLRGIAAGLGVGILRLGKRRAVSRAAYRGLFSLPGHGALDWDGAVPPPARGAGHSRAGTMGLRYEDAGESRT